MKLFVSIFKKMGFGRKIKIILLGLTIILPRVNGMASVDKNDIQRALNALYNYDFSKANQIFRTLCRGNPPHLLAPLGALATEWLDDQEKLGYKIANEKLSLKIDSTITIYQELRRNWGESAELNFFLGATLGLKARLSLGRKDWLGVLVNGYQAVKYIKKSAKLNPNYIELQLPLGVFNYYVGISRGYMKIASYLFETSGDKEEGLRQIRFAAEKAEYGKFEARGILAFIYLYLEDEPSKVITETKRLIADFPNNPYYRFLQAEAYLELQDIINAEREIEHLKRMLPKLKNYTYEEYLLRLYLLEGELAFAKGEYDLARQKLETYVRLYNLETDIPLSPALLKLGYIADLEGNRTEAVKYYRQLIELDNRTAACNKAKKFLKMPYKHANI